MVTAKEFVAFRHQKHLSEFERLAINYVSANETSRTIDESINERMKILKEFDSKFKLKDTDEKLPERECRNHHCDTFRQGFCDLYGEMEASLCRDCDQNVEINQEEI